MVIMDDGISLPMMLLDIIDHFICECSLKYILGLSEYVLIPPGDIGALGLFDVLRTVLELTQPE